MAQTRKPARLRMEVLEVRRVLTVALFGPVIPNGSLPNARIDVEQWQGPDMGHPSVPTIDSTSYVVDATVNPELSDGSLLLNTPTLEFHGIGNQLNELQPTQVTVSDLLVARNTPGILASDVTEPELVVDEVTSFKSIRNLLDSKTADIQPTLIEFWNVDADNPSFNLLGVVDGVFNPPAELSGSDVGGSHSLTIPTPDGGPEIGRQSDLAGAADGGINSGINSGINGGINGGIDGGNDGGNDGGIGSEVGDGIGGSIFDVPPTRLGLDVTDLPDPLQGGGLPTGDQVGSDLALAGPGDESGSDVTLGGEVDPQASDFITIDIGSNHPDTDPLDPSSIDIAMSAGSADGKSVGSSPAHVVASEIEMARHHRLQLAAASRLPVPVGGFSGQNAVNLSGGIKPTLSADDLVFAIGRETSSGSWSNPWKSETQVLARGKASQLRIVGDRSDEGEHAVQTQRRSESLLDSRSSEDGQRETDWHWTVEALLTSIGIGAMAFYDRYGHVSQEKRRFSLRS